MPCYYFGVIRLLVVDCVFVNCLVAFVCVFFGLLVMLIVMLIVICCLLLALGVWFVTLDLVFGLEVWCGVLGVGCWEVWV